MPREVKPVDPTFSEKRLHDASIQEIQLELFRRSAVSIEHNAAKVVEVLLASRHLWRGLIIDSLGVSEGGDWLQPSSMIKLRDVDQDFWNADTLYVLCPDRESADELAAKLPMDRFACMATIEEDQKIIDRALGGRHTGMVIVRFWWD
jgi:hypothetical protein